MPLLDSIANDAPPAAEDSIGSKLLREADVFVAGTLVGIKEELGERFTHPLSAAVEFAAGYGTSRAVALMEQRAGLLGLAVQGAGLALAYVAVKDAVTATKSASTIWSQTWDSPANAEENKALVGHGFGGYLVGSALIGYGAFRGAKAGYLRNQSTLATKELFQGNRDQAGVVMVRVGDAMGSGFAVDSEHIVTNYHVAGHGNRRVGSSIKVSIGGTSSENARVVAMHDHWDLAVLKTDSPHGLTPLKLAAPDKELAPGHEVLAVKRGLSGRLKAGPGTYEETGGVEFIAQKEYDKLNWLQKADENVRSRLMRLLSGPERNWPQPDDREGLFSRLVGVGHGWSGSPLIDRSTGEVVGVVSSGLYNPKTYRSEFSESLKGVRELLAQIKKPESPAVW